LKKRKLLNHELAIKSCNFTIQTKFYMQVMHSSAMWSWLIK